MLLVLEAVLRCVVDYDYHEDDDDGNNDDDADNSQEPH